MSILQTRGVDTGPRLVLSTSGRFVPVSSTLAVEPPLNIDSYTPARAFYLGYTGRCLSDEALRFLTVRGASHEDDDGNFVEPEKRNRRALGCSSGPMARRSP